MASSGPHLKDTSPRREAILIRRFAPGDERAVKALISQIMNEEFHEARTAYPTDDIENILTSYGGLGEAFFVAVCGDHVVGTVAVKKEDDRVALLRRLFVSGAFRKQQIGLKLIDRILQFCQEVGYEEIIFKTTSAMQAAVKTCQKRGFVPRAKIDLGGTELLKFSLSLRDGHKGTKSK